MKSKEVSSPGKFEYLFAFVLFLGAFFLGCGQKNPLPDYPQDAPIPGDVYTWQGEWVILSTSLVDTLWRVPDILLTKHAGGTTLIIIRDSSQVVGVYPSSINKTDKMSKLNPYVNFSTSGLTRPVLIAEGKNGEIFIYDAADSTIKKFGVNGGSVLWSLRDRAWKSVSGIAVDDSGNVFVSDGELKVIKKYASPEYYVPPGKYLGIWSEQGTGDSYVGKPSQLYYDGEALLIADEGESQYPSRVVKIRTDVPKTPAEGFRPVTSAQGIQFSNVSDVFSDNSMNFYVADTGNRRVLKFSKDGTFEKLVTAYLPPEAIPIERPVAIAADNTRVFIVDSPNNGIVGSPHNRIVIYEYK